MVSSYLFLIQLYKTAVSCQHSDSAKPQARKLPAGIPATQREPGQALGLSSQNNLTCFGHLQDSQDTHSKGSWNHNANCLWGIK